MLLNQAVPSHSNSTQGTWSSTWQWEEWQEDNAVKGAPVLYSMYSLVHKTGTNSWGFTICCSRVHAMRIRGRREFWFSVLSEAWCLLRCPLSPVLGLLESVSPLVPCLAGDLVSFLRGHWGQRSRSASWGTLGYSLKKHCILRSPPGSNRQGILLQRPTQLSPLEPPHVSAFPLFLCPSSAPTLSSVDLDNFSALSLNQ